MKMKENTFDNSFVAFLTHSASEYFYLPSLTWKKKDNIILTVNTGRHLETQDKAKDDMACKFDSRESGLVQK